MQKIIEIKSVTLRFEIVFRIFTSNIHVTKIDLILRGYGCRDDQFLSLFDTPSLGWLM